MTTQSQNLQSVFFFFFNDPNQAELQEVVSVDEDDDDGAAVTISSPSPAETPESPPSQVQPTLISSSPVRNATCNQHLSSCRKSCRQ